MKRLLCIVGPTGSGKTAVGICVAEKLHAEIVSVDSRQVYRGFRIGTAQPTQEENERVAHHLVDFQDANIPFTAGAYAKLARAKINELKKYGKNIVLVGGSGLYFRALFEGLFQGPPINEAYRSELRERAKKFGVPALHNELLLLDPTLAVKIQPHDYPRIERGLEVFYASGTPLSQWWEQGSERFGDEPVYVGLKRERPNVIERIAQRTHAMLQEGWVEEVEELVHAGYGEAIEREKFHGYRELASYLRNEVTLEEAENAINIVTRQYAKRQMSWFRHTDGVQWVDVGKDDAAEVTAEKVLEIFHQREVE